MHKILDMTETTTVSMPEELKKYADENGLSPSKLLQNAIKEEMQEVDKDKETELRERKEELESTIDYLENELNQKKEELLNVEGQLQEMTVDQDEIVTDLQEAVLRTFGTPSEEPEDIVSDYRFRFENIKNAIELCEDRNIGLIETDDYSDDLKQMLERKGHDPQDVLSTDSDKWSNAMDVINSNLTPQEKAKIENYAKEEFDL